MALTQLDSTGHCGYCGGLAEKGEENRRPRKCETSKTSPLFPLWCVLQEEEKRRNSETATIPNQIVLY